MRIRRFLHKGLRRLYADDNPKGLPADAVGLTFRVDAVEHEILDVNYEDYH